HLDPGVIGAGVWRTGGARWRAGAGERIGPRRSPCTAAWVESVGRMSRFRASGEAGATASRTDGQVRLAEGATEARPEPEEGRPAFSASAWRDVGPSANIRMTRRTSSGNFGQAPISPPRSGVSSGRSVQPKKTKKEPKKVRSWIPPANSGWHLSP